MAVSSLLHLSSVHTAQALPLSSPFLRTRRLSGQLGADYSLSNLRVPLLIQLVCSYRLDLLINQTLNRTYTEHSF